MQLIPYSLMVFVYAMPLVAQRADTAATKAAVIAADRALRESARAKGAGAVLDAFAVDAAIEFPGAPMFRGADAARRAFSERYGVPNSYDWQPRYAIAASDGRFGCVVGSSTYIAADTVRRGTYINCWRRSASGAWRIAGQQRSDGAPSASDEADTASIGIVPHSANLSSGPTALRDAQDADSAFARLGGEAASPGPAFGRYAAADAMFPGPNPTRGPAAIEQSFAGYPAARVLTWAPRREMGAAAGGLAFTVGDAATKVRESGAELGRSHYFTVWRLEADGSWKWVLDLGSSRP